MYMSYFKDDAWKKKKLVPTAQYFHEKSMESAIANPIMRIDLDTN